MTAWLFGGCFLLALFFLWVNSRAGKTVLPQTLAVEPALAAALEALPEEAEDIRVSLNQLSKQGWPQASQVAYLNQLTQKKLSLSDLSQQLRQFGSPAFVTLFQAGLTNQVAARQLLVLSLDLLDFPEGLSGRPSQTVELLGRIWPDLSPHDRFWAILARAVDLAFPGQSLLVSDDLLARQVHQLRYLLSTYQADWVRRHYGGSGLSDRQALVTYLAQADARDRLGEWLGLTSYDYQLTYDLGESSRLHNKRRFDASNPAAQPMFPENQISVNLKILINYHSEFILSSKGKFLNLMDRGGETVSGVVNGASFNYASRANRRHWELDVWPVGPHDPAFRRRQSKGYRSPNRSWRFRPGWKESFYNAKGHYALDDQSCHQAVKGLARGLEREIKVAREKFKMD